MSHRNRWFTVLKNGGSFHGKLLNNQRVPEIWWLDGSYHHFPLRHPGTTQADQLKIQLRFVMKADWKRLTHGINYSYVRYIIILPLKIGMECIPHFQTHPKIPKIALTKFKLRQFFRAHFWVSTGPTIPFQPTVPAPWGHRIVKWTTSVTFFKCPNYRYIMIDLV